MSLKTTLTGVLTICIALGSAGLALLQGHSPDYGATVAAITAGIGLISARDHTTTDAQVAAAAK